MVDADLPHLIIWKPLMGEGGLCPNAVEEAGSVFLVGEVTGRDLDDAPVLDESKRALAAVSFDEPMNGCHDTLTDNEMISPITNVPACRRGL